MKKLLFFCLSCLIPLSVFPAAEFIPSLAEEIYTNTSGFNNNLNASDTTIQSALDKLDNVTLGGSDNLTFYVNNSSVGRQSKVNFQGLDGISIAGSNVTADGQINTTIRILSGLVIPSITEQTLWNNTANKTWINYTSFVNNETADINWTHNFNTTGNILAATYGSDGSLSDAELRYLNNTSGNIMDLLALKLAIGGSAASLTSIPGPNMTGLIPAASWIAGGHLTGLNMVNASSGTLAVVRGGTGQADAPVNGSLLIGGEDGIFHNKTITAGGNITITNANGTITIEAQGDGAAAGGGNTLYVTEAGVARGDTVAANLSMNFSGNHFNLSTGAESNITLNKTMTDLWDTAYTARHSHDQTVNTTDDVIHNSINATSSAQVGHTETISATANAGASINTGQGAGYTDNGYAFTYKIYAYRTVKGIIIYSSSGVESNTVTDANTGVDICTNSVTWDAVAGAEGYRVFITDTLRSYNYDYFVDVGTNSWTDDGSAQTAGTTVTPNDALGFYNLVVGGNITVGTPNATDFYKNGATLTTFGISNYPNSGTDPVPLLIAGTAQVPMAFYSTDYNGGDIVAYVKGDSAGYLAFGGMTAIVFEAGGFGAGYETARFTGNKNVLIGTTTDDAVNKLQVNGGAKFANANVTGNFKVGGRVEAATYASDGSLTDAELRYLNNTSGNVMNLLAAKVAIGGSALTLTSIPVVNATGALPAASWIAAGHLTGLNASNASTGTLPAARYIVAGHMTGYVWDNLTGEPNQQLNTTQDVIFKNVTVGAGAYGVGWNGDQNVSTKDAVYDEIETKLDVGGSAAGLTSVPGPNVTGTVPVTALNEPGFVGLPAPNLTGTVPAASYIVAGHITGVPAPNLTGAVPAASYVAGGHLNPVPGANITGAVPAASWVAAGHITGVPAPNVTGTLPAASYIVAGHMTGLPGGNISGNINCTAVNATTMWEAGNRLLTIGGTGTGLSAPNGLNVTDFPKGFVIYNLTTSHDLAFWEMNYAATLASVTLTAVTSTANVSLEEWNSTGTGYVSTLMNVTNCAANTETVVTSFNETAIAAGNYLYINTTGAGAGTKLTVKVK